MKVFDQKFGPEILDAVPELPGVYHFLDGSGTVIYVGKAKRLKRRLSQYRLATRKRKHRRMRLVVAGAARFAYFECASHLDACLLEVKQIQQLKPKLNIASSFSFLYPYIGLKTMGGELSFVFTTKPEALADHAFFGAYRSRDVAAEAFFSLMRLLTFVGHKAKSKKGVRLPYTYAHLFRRLPETWADSWAAFFRGESRGALEELTLRLLDHVGARARAAEIQDELDALKRFWDGEALPLARAIAVAGYDGVYPVPQAERDPLFIRVRELGADRE